MVATKTQTVDKQKCLQLINSFLDHFRNCCRQKNAPNTAEFQNIVSRDFQNSCNGKVIGRTLEDFLRRIQDTQKKYSTVEFSRLQDCLISGNKAIVQYDINRTSQKGEKSQLNVMAIATIDDDVITHWSQVSHNKDKDSSH